MAGPWEKYASEPKKSGPWDRYSAPVAAPAAVDDRQGMRTAREVARRAGMYGQAAAEGAASLPLMALDAVAAPFRLGVNYLARQIGGENAPQAQPYQNVFSQSLTAPEIQPQNKSERLQTDVVRGVSGALAPVAGARAIPAAGSFIKSMAQAPVQQAIAGGAAGLAAGETRERGGSELQQAGAGLIGGVAGAGGAGTVSRTGAAAKAMIDPFRQGGREVIAGRALNKAASSPDAASMALAGTPEGSLRTAGQVSRDPGIASLENRLRALEPGRFAERNSRQNEARDVLLDSVASGGQKTAIDKMVKRRDDVTQPLRDQAFKQAEGQRVPTERVLSEIDALLAVPENQGESVQKALQSFRRQIGGSSREVDGIVVEEPITDARSLYAIRKEINRVLEGRYVGAEESVLRYAGGQLAQVRRSIDDAISEVAPTWKQYLTKYAQLSRPIDRAETVGEIRQRTALSAPDLATGRENISQAKWKNVVTKAMPDLQDKLTKGQIKKLQQIGADLDLGASALAAGRTAGSDTAANLVAQKSLSVANIMGQFLSSKGGVAELPPGVATLFRPASWLTQMADNEIRELIVDAMLDPKLAAKLMQRGTAENMDGFLKALEQNATRGTVQGAAQAGQ